MGNIAILQNCFLWYYVFMDKNKLLLPDELLSEMTAAVSRAGGHARAARSILKGGSAAHLADVLHRRRPVSDGMAKKFGYRRIVVYVRDAERIQPPASIDDVMDEAA